MVNDVKISLTINIPGGTRHCVGTRKIPYVIKKKDLTTKKLPANIRNQVVKKGTNTTKVYEYLDSQIHINMYRCAYEYFISDETPEHYYKKDWRKLSDNQKLDWHMRYIADSYNGTSYVFNVLED